MAKEQSLVYRDGKTIMTPLIMALLTALCFGTSDFIGGALSRAHSAARITLWSQAVVAGLYTCLLMVMPSPFSAAGFTIGLGVGLGSVLGIMLLYYCLARGPVGVVASATAIVAATIPAVWGWARGDQMGPTLWIGVFVGLVAIALLSAPSKTESTVSQMTPRLWMLTVCSGMLLSSTALGFSFVPNGASVWPLLGSGAGALVVAIVLNGSGRKAAAGQEPQLGRRGAVLIIMMGIMIVGAYWTQLWAIQHAQSLAQVSIVVSMYPLPTMLWAHFIHRERLTLVQYAGVICALLGLALVAL